MTHVFRQPPNLMGRLGKNPSCNEILPRLYLGDIIIATNKDEISKLGITDMITVEIKPLAPVDLAPTVKRYLYINVMDHQKQDLLSHFDTSNEFIETALKSPNNKVYVHCVAGISRSATLVIAYIMKTRSMSYQEAFDMVLQKRKIIDPNEGFVLQCYLYQRMKYTIDISNMEYRRLVLESLVFEFRLVTQTLGKSPGPSGIAYPPGLKNLVDKNNVSILFDQYYNKLNLQQVSKFPNVYDSQTAFRCNKCRTIVFYAISVIENKTEGPGSSGVSLSSPPTVEKSVKDANKECPFIFIEPQPWMSKNVLEREGNLECYKCKRKLGKFDWTSSESCSCRKHNSHLNFNIFKIMKKKVDRGINSNS